MFVMDTYTADDVLTVIKSEVEKSSYRKVAAEKEISLGSLADVLSGRSGISESIAAAFGFVREVTTEVTFRKAS
jgi:hypothetical protein